MTSRLRYVTRPLPQLRRDPLHSTHMRSRPLLLQCPCTRSPHATVIFRVPPPACVYSKNVFRDHWPTLNTHTQPFCSSGCGMESKQTKNSIKFQMSRVPVSNCSLLRLISQESPPAALSHHDQREVRQNKSWNSHIFSCTHIRHYYCRKGRCRSTMFILTKCQRLLPISRTTPGE